MKVVPLSECKARAVYKLHSRNLVCGVFNGTDGFIGIREKFGSQFLDTEYHQDTGPPHGTATPLELIGSIPDNVVLKEDLGSKDTITGRPTAFDRPISQGGRGWYFTDTGEASEDIRSARVSNKQLFEILESFMKEDDAVQGS